MPNLDARALRDLLDRQDGVISRRQLHEIGAGPADVKRLVRRKELVRVIAGVFVDHTGELSWEQRAWVGLLSVWPAALAGESAIRSVVGPSWRHHRDSAAIEIAIAPSRNVAVPPGYVRRRPSGFAERVQWNASPPRIRLEDAVLDVAARQPTETAAVGRLADVCQTRRTTAIRIHHALAQRRRLRRRVWLGEVLADIAAGTCSVLEHGYLIRVERAHGLPRPARQQATTSDRGKELRDVAYDEFGLVVELDGRLFHDEAAQRDRDLDRDLDAAVEGATSVRLGWGQVFDRSCRTARQIGRLLAARGWAGAPHPCGRSCTMTDG